MKENTIVYTHDLYMKHGSKTAHALVRGSDRFTIMAVIDFINAGHDAGDLLDGKKNNIPIFASVSEAVERLGVKPENIILGGAFAGGKPPKEWMYNLLEAVKKGISLISGLHYYFSEDKTFIDAAKISGAKLLDIRKPKHVSELHFWTGKIYDCKIPRVAVLGTDCSQGKRTTAKILTELCKKNGIKAEMIYTGQTGWMQGNKHGFILDSVLNDFVGGELEHAILECERISCPDIMFIEGQSSLRNPSGPCGAELLLSADAHAVILQYTPFRKTLVGWEKIDHIALKMPNVEDEIKLINSYGKDIIALALNGQGGSKEQLIDYQKVMQNKIGKIVVSPIDEGVDQLLPIIQKLIQ